MVDAEITGELLLNVKESAKLLRCSEATVYRSCEAGLMPHIRKGRRLFFRREDLRRWIDSLRVGPVLADSSGSVS